MFVYIVTYDLNKPGQRYKDVYAYVKQYAHEHAGTSAWVIQTDKSAEAIRIDLEKVTDQNDTFYIFQLLGTWNGRGPPNVNQWLQTVGLRVG